MFTISRVSDIALLKRRPHHQPLNCCDSIRVQTISAGHRAFPIASSQRSVKFPIQRAWVTQVTRDVLFYYVNLGYKKPLSCFFYKPFWLLNNTVSFVNIR